MTIKVLVIDDSALMRKVLTEIINNGDGLEVVGSAADAASADALIRRLEPDVVTLDVEMPGENGLVFLERLMRERPLPVLMISGHTERGSDNAFKALELGAVDIVCKPRFALRGLRPQSEEICEKIRAAFLARLNQKKRLELNSRSAGVVAAPALPAAGLESNVLRDKLVLVGASTGGTEAIKDFLTTLPIDMPGILIVQHMPEMFTGSFARRLDGLCKLHVKEAENGERVLPGNVYLAPGHSHLAVKRSGGSYFCELLKTEPVNRHRPSVDVLFHSAARQVGANGLGVILTGMGKDGAQGMLAMRQAGCWNIGQDQSSCVVYGMPREAWMIGAVDEQAPLAEIAQRVVNRLRLPSRKSV